jgi:hypothetical protein
MTTDRQQEAQTAAGKYLTAFDEAKTLKEQLLKAQESLKEAEKELVTTIHRLFRFDEAEPPTIAYNSGQRTILVSLKTLWSESRVQGVYRSVSEQSSGLAEDNADFIAIQSHFDNIDSVT